mgnify:CR=1 FL=1
MVADPGRPSGMSDEAAQKLAALGIDLSGPSGGESGPTSPPVYFGTGKRKRLPGREEKSLTTPGGDDVKSLDDANDDFYRLNDQELAAFQDRILSAGIVDEDSIVYGDYDDTTLKVWANINERAARFYKVGQKRTPSEVLDMIEAANRAAGMTPDTDVDPGAVTSVTPGDTLEQQVQQAASQRLRRKLKPSEVQKFIAVYQGMERSANSQQVAASRAAQDGVSSEVTSGPSMDASALGYVDNTFATEAAGQDVSSYFETLKQMVGGS